MPLQKPPRIKLTRFRMQVTQVPISQILRIQVMLEILVLLKVLNLLRVVLVAQSALPKVLILMPLLAEFNLNPEADRV